MRPRAPTRLIASVANPLSCRTMAKSSERSAVPPLGRGVTGYPCTISGELAVEGGHMLRAGAVPFGGGSGVARCFGGAAAPVSRSRLAVGGHRAVHNPREVVEGKREVLAVP